MSRNIVKNARKTHETFAYYIIQDFKTLNARYDLKLSIGLIKNYFKRINIMYHHQCHIPKDKNLEGTIFAHATKVLLQFMEIRQL